MKRRTMISSIIYGSIRITVRPQFMFRLYITDHILIKELENEWNTVTKYQMLPKIFKLVDMIQTKMLHQQDQNS